MCSANKLKTICLIKLLQCMEHISYLLPLALGYKQTDVHDRMPPLVSMRYYILVPQHHLQTNILLHVGSIPNHQYLKKMKNQYANLNQATGEEKQKEQQINTFRIRPHQITHRTIMRNLLFPINGSNLTC